MTEMQFNEIKERLADWRSERSLTYENQREEFLGNVFEKVSEYFRAKDDLERVDALCDIVIFCFNSFNLDYKTLEKQNDYDVTKISIVEITDDLTYTTAKFMRKDFKDFNNIYRLVFNCEHLCKNLGFDFYKCMLEKIKEIESRTGFYDERLKKFVDTICAFSKDEALSNVSKDFGFLGNSIIYKLTQEDKNFWFITCKEIETNLQIDYKVKKNL
ncbi:hypothetical protein APU76_08475 [Campylobacter jejuni]|uniref:Uncharacterized protein n=1 Tax=Campylobacter jejuni TaxID=197 RepID=A0A5T0Z9L3_CAMJU|nr:hypothetical protein [Campylobacter jejuni]EAI4551916.1 hypothetical protein [Campylobacter jejuni]EAI4557272.1 hypothetical protein [Campylobacter jejuni]EAI4757610.1 hypothetical protein [Campylobacter jejuni]EAK5837640.1 hypothetical protein [Campylobacter jejuni]